MAAATVPAVSTAAMELICDCCRGRSRAEAEGGRSVQVWWHGHPSSDASGVSKRGSARLALPRRLGRVTHVPSASGPGRRRRSPVIIS